MTIQNVFIDNNSVEINNSTKWNSSNCFIFWYNHNYRDQVESVSHTFIDSGSFRLKDGSDIRLIMDVALEWGSQFSVQWNCPLVEHSLLDQSTKEQLVLSTNHDSSDKWFITQVFFFNCFKCSGDII